MTALPPTNMTIYLRNRDDIPESTRASILALAQADIEAAFLAGQRTREDALEQLAESQVKLVRDHYAATQKEQARKVALGTLLTRINDEHPCGGRGSWHGRPGKCLIWEAAHDPAFLDLVATVAAR